MRFLRGGETAIFAFSSVFGENCDFAFCVPFHRFGPAVVGGRASVFTGFECLVSVSSFCVLEPHVSCSFFIFSRVTLLLLIVIEEENFRRRCWRVFGNSGVGNNVFGNLLGIVQKNRKTMILFLFPPKNSECNNPLKKPKKI